MARNRHALIPLTIVTLLRLPSPASAAIPSRLRDDISAFIPACAEECLVSFLTVNYARGDDTDDYLSLDFVCANRGRSGYTVGEGALQCLTGERNVGFCSAVEAGDEDVAFSRAYQLCSGQTAVAKPNGGTITATLRFGPKSGILTFAPITSSATPLPIPTATDTTITATDISSSSSSSSGSSSTLSYTETTLTTATPTSSSTSTPTRPSPSRTTTTSASSTPTSTQDAPPSTPPLSKGQIAGISIGAVCIAAGVAFGVILLVRFLLRRRRRHSGSTIGSFGNGGGGGRGGGSYRPARDTWGYGFDKTSHSSDRSSWITRETPGMSRYPAMPAPSSNGGHHANPQQHQPYNRDSWRPSAIGLAISPSKLSGGTPAATPTRLRPLSKLLPAKPDMPPAAPRTTSSPPQAAMRPAYQEGRGNPVSQQSLHPIAAQFMRPNLPQPAPSAPQPPAAAAAASNNNNQPPYSLRLVIPDGSKPLPVPVAQDKAPVQSRPSAGRDSALTEFEEDDLRRSTSPSAGQIWCPPSAGPDSAAMAAPYYVSDGYGNWVLGDARNTTGQEMQSPLSAGTVPRVATARSGIVTMAVQTQIPARRSREPLVAAAAAGEQVNKSEEQELPKSIQNTPRELAATPNMQGDQTQSVKQESETQAMADPKTPRMRSIIHTPKTVPSPLFSRQPNPRSVSNPLPSLNTMTVSQGRSLTGGGRSRATSGDSGITTFSIGSDDAPDNNNLKSPLSAAPTTANNLSPVAESPRGRVTASNTGSNDLHATTTTNMTATGPFENTSGGTSPVSYPRIPGRGAAPGPAPPPPGSSRGGARFSGGPPSRMLLFNQQDTGQPSPTLGRESFSRNQQPNRPYSGSNPPEAAHRYSRGGGGMSRGGWGRGGSTLARPRSHDTMSGAPHLCPPSQISLAQQPRTGSPTMRIVEPSPSPEPQHATPYPTTTTAPPPRDDRSLLPSAARPPRRRPPSHLPHPFPMYPQPRPARAPTTTQTQQEPTIPNLGSDRDSFSRYPGHPMPIPQPYQRQHEPCRAPPSYNPAAHDNSSQEALATTSSSSTSSLLLAKRLGTTRAANMALRQPPPQSQEEKLGIRNRWQQSPQPQQQQQQQQQRQQTGSGNGGGDATTQGLQAQGYPATPDLPSTPTWLPRLTPTRRGEDLVLNVG